MSWKDARVDAVVAEVLCRRDDGERLSDEAVLADHGELQPELGDALSLLGALERARSRGGSSNAKPVVVLTDEDLDLPIGFCTADDCAPMPGVIRIDGYVVTREIDRGGQASVYEAIQRSTGRRVAAKVLAGGRFASDRARARFDREATILARLDHQGIVCIIDRGQTHDGFVYLVMPLVDGPTLDACLADQPLTLRGLCLLFSRIARAVEAAHCMGVIHRDLKPSNIRVDRHGHPRVLDFGLAQLLDDGVDSVTTLTADRHVVGSTPYSSPEQVAGRKDLDGRSDVYSLGLLLYEAVAGRPVFNRALPLHEMLHHILSVTPDRPTSHRAHKAPEDKGIDSIVGRCLAKSPDYRYRSAGALADDLEAVAEGRSISGQKSESSTARTVISIIVAMIIAVSALGMALRGSATPTVPDLIVLPSYRNSVGLKMLLVPAGPMLTTVGQTTIRQPFWLSSTEVTVAAYRALMPGDKNGDDAQLPATGVTWYEAAAFCRLLSDREQKHYRLPTPDEWKYACRAGDRFIRLSTPELNQVAWSAANGHEMLHPVASLKPNAFGFSDMLGNAAEWGDSVAADAKAPLMGGSFQADPTTCTPDSIHYVSRRSISAGYGFRILAEK